MRSRLISAIYQTKNAHARHNSPELDRGAGRAAMQLGKLHETIQERIIVRIYITSEVPVSRGYFFIFVCYYYVRTSDFAQFHSVISYFETDDGLLIYWGNVG